MYRSPDFRWRKTRGKRRLQAFCGTYFPFQSGAGTVYARCRTFAAEQSQAGDKGKLLVVLIYASINRKRCLMQSCLLRQFSTGAYCSYLQKLGRCRTGLLCLRRVSAFPFCIICRRWMRCGTFLQRNYCAVLSGRNCIIAILLTAISNARLFTCAFGKTKDAQVLYASHTVCLFERKDLFTRFSVHAPAKNKLDYRGQAWFFFYN